MVEPVKPLDCQEIKHWVPFDFIASQTSRQQQTLSYTKNIPYILPITSEYSNLIYGVARRWRMQHEYGIRINRIVICCCFGQFCLLLHFFGYFIKYNQNNSKSSCYCSVDYVDFLLKKCFVWKKSKCFVVAKCLYLNSSSDISLCIMKHGIWLGCILSVSDWHCPQAYINAYWQMSWPWIEYSAHNELNIIRSSASAVEFDKRQGTTHSRQPQWYLSVTLAADVTQCFRESLANCPIISVLCFVWWYDMVWFNTTQLFDARSWILAVTNHRSLLSEFR